MHIREPCPRMCLPETSSRTVSPHASRPSTRATTGISTGGAPSMGGIRGDGAKGDDRLLGTEDAQRCRVRVSVVTRLLGGRR